MADMEILDDDVSECPYCHSSMWAWEVLVSKRISKRESYVYFRCPCGKNFRKTMTEGD